MHSIATPHDSNGLFVFSKRIGYMQPSIPRFPERIVTENTERVKAMTEEAMAVQ